MLIRDNIVLGAWGLLSFITLIVYLRWAGTWEDEKKDAPPKGPKRQARNGRSILDLNGSALDQPRAVTAGDGAFKPGRESAVGHITNANR
jgi:hypothetical protein